jgi:hypothetical protein
VENAILLCTDPLTPTNPGLAAALRGSGIVHVPLHAFDPAPAVAVYTMAALRQSDVRRAIGRNRHWVRLLECERVFHFVDGHGTDLRCIPADPITVATALQPDLPPGAARPLGLFFEVELERHPSGSRPFTVNGTLHADGVVYALAASFAGERGRIRACARRVLDAAHPNGLRLDIRDNVVVACVSAGGRSWLDEVSAAVNGDLTLSEFAIGTNRLPEPDFSVNAQVNEGAGGIHVGLGVGEQGMHVDFGALAARRVRSPC